MFDKQEVQFLEKMFAKVTATMATKEELAKMGSTMVTKDMFERAMKNVVTKDVLRGELDDVKVEMRDEIHSCLSASECRTMKKIEETRKNLLQRMDKMEEEILDGVSEIIGDRILPQIDDHDIRLVRLERRAA